MAKRKIDCSLDDIVTEYLKKVKCEKTFKIFGDSCENDHSKSLKKFIQFLKQKDVKKDNRVEDDLGFEINFGMFQPEPKVSFLPQYLFGSRLLDKDLRFLNFRRPRQNLSSKRIMKFRKKKLKSEREPIFRKNL